MSDDLDFQQSLAQLFTLVPYGQLILEQAQLDGHAGRRRRPGLRDGSCATSRAYAIDLHGKASSTDAQQQWALDSIRKPVIDDARDDRIYAEVRALAGAYVMPA